MNDLEKRRALKIADLELQVEEINRQIRYLSGNPEYETEFYLRVVMNRQTGHTMVEQLEYIDLRKRITGETTYE